MTLLRRNLRVMVDTTVLVAGTVWPRWPYEVLRHAERGDYQLVLAPVLFEEARRKFREKFPAHVTAFEEFLASIPHEKVDDPAAEAVVQNRNLMRDINDVPIALAAIQARVDYFVSEDRDFTDRSETTTQLHAQLHVLLSGTFLREVMGWTSDELEAVRGRTWADLEG